MKTFLHTIFYHEYATSSFLHIHKLLQHSDDNELARRNIDQKDVKILCSLPLRTYFDALFKK